MDDRMERLLSWSQSEQKGPWQIEVHPTNRCNMDCVMCGTMTVFRDLEQSEEGFKRTITSQWEMPDKRWLTLVDEGAELGVRRWLLTGGGEPFMRREATLGMIKRIKHHGMYGNINTNGTLLTEKDVRLFVELDWDMVMFSIDSHEQKVHDSIRRLPNGFNLAERTMRRFKRIKSELKSESPKVVFNTVLTNQNYNKLDKMLEFCADIGGHDVTFIPLIDFKPAFDTDLRLTNAQREELRSLIPIIKDLSVDLGVNTNVDTIVPEKIEDTTRMDSVILNDVEQETPHAHHKGFASLPCYEPYLNMVIRMTGSVGPCCMLEDRNISIRDRSLADVWHGNFFTRLREQMEQHKLFGACKNCVYMQMMGNADLRQQFRCQGDAQ